MKFDVLEEYLEEQRYTVVKFCELIEVDPSTYYKWKDNPSRMKLSTFNKIVDVLKLNQKQKSKLLE